MSDFKKAQSRAWRHTASLCRVGTLKQLVPITSWIPEYSIKDNLAKDIIAGITVCCVQIPQGITFAALLAAQKARYGLYSSFIPAFIMAIFTSSHHVSMGVTALTCLLMGETITAMHPDLSMNATQEHWDILYQNRIEDLSAMSFYIGLIFAIGSIFNLGYLMKYLSRPMMSGYSSGAALHIFTSQVSELFGVQVERQNGPGKLVRTYIEIFKALSQLTGETWQRSVICFSMGSGFLIFLILCRFINNKYGKKYLRGIPLPSALIVVVIGTLITRFTKINETFDVGIVGHIPKGLPTPIVPQIASFSRLIGTAIPIMIVGYANSVTISTIVGEKHGYADSVRPNQEMFAIGAANIFSCFFGCLPCFGSISRTCVQNEAGGKTQITSLVSATLLIPVVAALTDLFYYTPKVSLATIVLVSVLSLISKFQDFLTYLKVDKYEAVVWIVSFLCTMFVDITYGLFSSIAICLLLVILRTQFDGVKTEIKTSLVDEKTLQMHQDMKGRHNVVHVHFGAPLHYLNRDAFRFGVEKRMRESAIEYGKLNELYTVSSLEGEEPKSFNPKQQQPVLILEVTSPFCDFTGSTTLVDVVEQYRKKDVDVRLVNTSANVKLALERLASVELGDIRASVYS